VTTISEQVNEGQSNFIEVPNVEPPPLPPTLEGDLAGPVHLVADTVVPAAEPATVGSVLPAQELDEGQQAPGTPNAVAETIVPSITFQPSKKTSQPNSLTPVARAFAMLSTGFATEPRANQASSA
jgi:hypothetical protein